MIVKECKVLPREVKNTGYRWKCTVVCHPWNSSRIAESSVFLSCGKA